MTLYYTTHPNGGLVFAEASTAEYNSRIHTALSTSKSWREFREAMPEDAYDAIIDQFRQALEEGDLEELPQDDDAFDGAFIPGYYDGDYPEWLQQSMDYLLPEELLERYGEMRDTALNGSYWHIDTEHEQELVEELRRLGQKVTRRDDLRFQ
jgi:hypothetical protein